VRLTSNTLEALEVYPGAGTLHFFISGKQIPCRVTGVRNDVYFRVWYFICVCETIYIIIIIICTTTIIFIVIFMFFFLSAFLGGYFTELWSFITFHTFIPLHTKWLEVWRTQMDKRVNCSNLIDLLKTGERLGWKIIFFNLRVVDYLLINC
jgi:hypothetical protein